MTNWNDYTRAELLQKANERGIEIDPQARKPEMVEAHERADRADEISRIGQEMNAAQEESGPEVEHPATEEPVEEEATVDAPEPAETEPAPATGDALSPVGDGRIVRIDGLTKSYRANRATSSVIALQKALTMNGLYSGKLDGIAGPKTRRAVTNGNEKSGVTGDEPTKELLEALGFDAR